MEKWDISKIEKAMARESVSILKNGLSRTISEIVWKNENLHLCYILDSFIIGTLEILGL